MIFFSTRFGTIDCTEDDIFTIPEGFLGFPTYTRFVVVNHKESSIFRWIQSVEQPALAFLVMDPAAVEPTYMPELAETDAAALMLEEETPRIVYAIVTIPPGKPEEMTLNLAGPLVINAERKIGRQVVIQDEQWSPRHAAVSVRSLTSHSAEAAGRSAA